MAIVAALVIGAGALLAKSQMDKNSDCCKTGAECCMTKEACCK